MRSILLSALLSSLAACSTSPAQFQSISSAPVFQARKAPVQTQAVTEITPKEAFEWLSDHNAQWQILDVRTPQEFGEGHLKQAELMNFYDSDFRIKLEKMNRHQPTIIYCRSGNRSGQALKIMRELGFKNVYDLQGGILAWQAAGFPVQK